MNRNIFPKDSFWNRPVPEKAVFHARNGEWLQLLSQEPTGNLGINTDRFTIPVYEVNEKTPRGFVHKRKESKDEARSWTHFAAWEDNLKDFDHAPDFDHAVPMPPDALPDKATDSHLCLVDWQRRLAWDFWNVVRLGASEWKSRSAISYSLDDDGVFSSAKLGPVNDGDSIHFHGPCRASGAPLLAGLIMYDEILAGRITHKLAFACRYPAYKEFVYPAIWTDGIFPGGIPEGTLIQLDPELDINRLQLLPGEKTVVKALQEYGMVCVDFAGGTVLYAENLNHRSDISWKGLLSPEGLKQISMQQFRVIQTGPVTRKGDRLRKRQFYTTGPQPDYSGIIASP
jgi:hypothetical protein